MRLLRLELTDVAGIREAELAFPSEGASLVAAPNEAGKSTLIRAFHLLLTEKASSKAGHVRALRRAGVDKASVVSAELLLDGERLRLTKSFNHGSGRTVLELLDAGGGYQGPEAHDAFVARYRAHVDEALFELLRFAQGRALEPLAAKRSDVVTSRLAAEADAVDEDDALLTAIATFAASNWHQGGGAKGGPKPKGALKVLTDDVEHRRGVCDDLRARVAAAEAAVVGLGQLESRAAALRAEREDIERRIAQQLVLQEARLAVALWSQRRGRLEALERAEAGRTAAATRCAEDSRLRTEATAARAAATASVERASARLTEARAREARARARSASELVASCDDVRARIAADPVDAELLQRANALDLDLARDRAVLAGTAWQVHAVARRPVILEVDGRPIELGAGETLEQEVLASLQHDGEDWAELRVVAPEATARLAEDVAGREAAFAELLATAAVDDLEGLRARGAARKEAVAELAATERTLADLLGRDTLEVVLAGGGGDAPAGGTPLGDDAEEETAVHASVAELEAALSAETTALAAAEAEMTRLEASATEVAEALEAAEAASSVARAALEADRAAGDDDALRARGEEAAAVLGAVSSEAEPALDLDPELDPESARRAIDAELDALDERRIGLETSRQLAALAAAELEDAERELAPLADELARRFRDAEAAVRLTARLTAARSEQADRYRGPLRARIATHLTALLGEGADVELDDSLRILRRTRRGEGWLEWDELSMGAREQLGIISGLAMAELAGPDGVPFLLDDAIVHSDAARSARLAALLGGTSAQVIVLTCRDELVGLLPAAEVRLVTARDGEEGQ